MSHDMAPQVPHEEQLIMEKVVFENKYFPFKKRKWVAFAFVNNYKIILPQRISISASTNPRISDRHGPSPEPTSDGFMEEEIPFKKRSADVVELIDVSDDDSIVPVQPTQILGTILKKKVATGGITAMVLVLLVDTEADADKALWVSLCSRPHKATSVGW